MEGELNAPNGLCAVFKRFDQAIGCFGTPLQILSDLRQAIPVARADDQTSAVELTHERGPAIAQAVIADAFAVMDDP